MNFIGTIAVLKFTHFGHLAGIPDQEPDHGQDEES